MKQKNLLFQEPFRSVLLATISLQPVGNVSLSVAIVSRCHCGQILLIAVLTVLSDFQFVCIHNVSLKTGAMIKTQQFWLVRYAIVSRFSRFLQNNGLFWRYTWRPMQNSVKKCKECVQGINMSKRSTAQFGLPTKVLLCLNNVHKFLSQAHNLKCPYKDTWIY